MRKEEERKGEIGKANKESAPLATGPLRACRMPLGNGDKVQESGASICWLWLPLV